MITTAKRKISKPKPTLKKDLDKISFYSFHDEEDHIGSILPSITLSFSQKNEIAKRATYLIEKLRKERGFSIEQFFNKYHLSSSEGAALVSLSEGLVRIPDIATSIELLKDKLLGKNWSEYIKLSNAKVVELASLGLYLSSRMAHILSATQDSMFARIGEPAFATAMKSMISAIGKEFIIAEYIDDAISKAKSSRAKKNGKWRYSFDLLGEGARNFQQAEGYYERYLVAIKKLGEHFPYDDKASNGNASLEERPNLSVKLTALYPRFELIKIEDIKQYLLPKLVAMILQMQEHGITISFDAEEASRLDIYLEIITELVTHPALQGYNGFGVVVQAYQKRALKVLEYIVALSAETSNGKTGKRIFVRLVKGAYWDSEIKTAQINSMPDYPVFTKKEHTDLNYIACAKYMLSKPENIFCQFATHNAVTAATIEEIATDSNYEFQKLYGMGDSVHSELVKNHAVRIYAPIGEMYDLLAYLMRRMLENGANNSFVHLACKLPIENLLKDIYNWKKADFDCAYKNIPLPKNIYKNRERIIGFDLGDKVMMKELSSGITKYENKIYEVGAIIDGKEILNARKAVDHFKPAKYAEKIASVTYIGELELEKAMESANSYSNKWSLLPVEERAKALNKIADLFKKHEFEIMSILMREAGKSIKDAISEVHEAVDFCRYYAAEAEQIMQERKMPSVTGEENILSMEARGVFLCISPWNFPLAILTGQIVAALVTGNTVIAKAADQTPIIANYAIKLMHEAGIPKQALHLVIAPGSMVGKYLCSHKALSGVAFTGSCGTAKIINKTLAENQDAIIPFIAETGGQNAMIVDSSALLEQVTDDVIASAFHSAGQRCSALRVLYIQDEIYDKLKEMLVGAVNTLKIGDTIDISSDIGPVIDKQALDGLIAHIKNMTERGFNLLTKHTHIGMAKDGYFFYPHIFEIDKISDLDGEKFGPILHLVRYKSKDLDKVIDEINDYGFGLTFGIHSRIEKRIDYIKARVKVGNVYANRSIIGAQVESQPFGGRGLSGTGFKAGGPHYLLRFLTEKTTSINLTAIGGNLELLA